jgi:hypothetical protein
MCAPIPKGRWSWKHEYCTECGTSNRKHPHKGRGLCINCFDKDRAKKPIRKQQLKNQHDKWYASVKGTPEYKKWCREHVSHWQKVVNPSKHRRNWQTRNLKNKFKKFILGQARKTKIDGLTFRNDDGTLVKTCIKPNRTNTEMDDTVRQIQIFKEVFYKLKI